MTEVGIPWRAIASRPIPETYLQATAGSRRYFSLAKVLLSAQPQLRQGCHLANVG
jgi:hypothetical protein